MNQELITWYNSIPPCTRFLFSSFTGTTLLGALLVDPSNLIFIPDQIFKFSFPELWRIYTSFFYERIGLDFIFQLYFLYRYSNILENTKFAGKTADYAWFLLLVSIFILITSIFMPLYLYNKSLIMAIVYLWSQHNRDMIVTFLFGLNFKAVYLPFVLLIYEYVAQPARGIPWAMVIGLISGHLYYFLEDLYPATGGSRFIKTPQWLYRYFPLNTNPNGVRTSYGRVYIPPSPQVPTPMRGHNWGRGQQLGSGD